MTLQATVVVLGVDDLARSKQFYGEGLGCAIEQDYPNFVSFRLGDGSSSLGLHDRKAAADEAGVSAEGAGFRGVTFHYIVDSREAVDDVIGQAETAGGRVVKAPGEAQWGGYFGYFSDPDGNLWKVASAS